MNAPQFAPFALYLLPEEKRFWDHLKTGVPFSYKDQNEVSMRVIKALESMGYIKPLEPAGHLAALQNREVETIQRTLINSEGFIIVEIPERRTYTLKPHRFDLVRAIQRFFMPIKTETRGESRERLDTFIEEWAKKNAVDTDDLGAGSWLMSYTRKDTPSQGSALVTLVKEVGHLYLTIEGLEGFNLERSEKVEGRVASPRSFPNDPSRQIIPSAPSQDSFDPVETTKKLIQHYEVSIEQLKQRNRNDQGSIADIQKQIENLNAKIKERDAEIQKHETAIKHIMLSIEAK